MRTASFSSLAAPGLALVLLGLPTALQEAEAQDRGTTPAAQFGPRSLEPIYERNFGADLRSGDFITAVELEAWARNHNLALLPDTPLRNLQDYRAQVIPAGGLEFELDAPGDGRVFLYLDFVSYRPLENPNLPKARWLEVFVNDRRIATLYQGAGVYLETPEILLIEREMAMDRRLRVRLRPAPGDGFFAIWDAFVSRHREEATRLRKLRRLDR